MRIWPPPAHNMLPISRSRLSRNWNPYWRRYRRSGCMTRSRRPKRAIDIVGASAGLLILAPLLLAITGAIRVTMGRPVLFRQRRPGYRAQLFTMLKFRTMREACGTDGQPLPDDDRVTRLGNLLRRT